MITILSKMGIKLAASLSTLSGWLMAVCVFIADYFGGHKFVCWLVIAVTVMDAIWGIAVSLKLGNFTTSELARQTIVKLAVYGCILFAFVGLDRVADMTISASVIGSLIVLVETWSSCGAMLILYPHIVILRLLKKHLAGEIASKLNCDVSEVENVLKEIHTRKKKK